MNFKSVIERLATKFLSGQHISGNVYNHILKFSYIQCYQCLKIKYTPMLRKLKKKKNDNVNVFGSETGALFSYFNILHFPSIPKFELLFYETLKLFCYKIIKINLSFLSKL